MQLSGCGVMAGKRAFFFFRFGIVLLSCALLSLFPWAISALSSPLPSDLQSTGTVLAITRTARLDPELAEQLVQALGFTATPTTTNTNTITPTATDTMPPTASPTHQPTGTFTPTITRTPLPEVRGTVKANINTYTCPGAGFKKGALQFGAAFHVLGWDQTLVEGKVITWILFEDDMDQPQRWLQQSDYVTISDPDFTLYIPRAACRAAP
jgi:hypothetical protein